jgi:DmsE family decaheme c-type cytochrome
MARAVKLIGLAAGLGLVGAVVFALLAPSRAPAQNPAAPQTPAPQTAALPAGYVGADACKACHEPAFEKFSRTKMGRLFLKSPRNTQEGLACENCHGPGQAHVEAGGGKGKGGLITFAKGDKTPVDRRNHVCLTCHTKDKHLFWQGSAHEARDVPCTGCHKVMEDVTRKGQLARPTELETCGTCHIQQRAAATKFSRHPQLEGKMACTSCHSPHGSITPALLKEASPNDTCYTCHAEKRGPFLYEHPPVMESCTNCHNPHGSNHAKMLTMTVPRLCQQCHIETRHPTSPYGRATGDLKFTMGRACGSCHTTIHGTNHPSGHGFTR